MRPKPQPSRAKKWTNGDGLRYTLPPPPSGSPSFAEPEACDDGNLTNGDGCNSNCEVEGNCGGSNSLCCGCLPPDLLIYNEENCANDPLCGAARDCALESGCFEPVPADCYCGEGVPREVCENPAFVPLGPCADEIAAGASEVPLSNAQILQEYFSDDTSSGNAMLIVGETVLSGCSSWCLL